MKYLLIILVLFSSCKLFTKSQGSKDDSSHVISNKEQTLSGDTSKRKSEATNTKETVYYPQPIYIQGKDGESKVVFVPQTVKETLSNKEESQNGNYQQVTKDFMDSMRAFMQTRSSQTTVKAFDFWQIFALGIVGLVVLVILYVIIKKIKII